MNNIYEDLEKLKKELWHISRVMLPRLTEMIADLGGGSSPDITALQTAIAECQADIATLEGTLSSVNTDVTNLQSATATLQTQVSGQSEDITSLTNQVSGHSSSISAISTQVEGLSSSLSGLQSDLSDCESDMSALSTRVSAAESSIQSLSGLESQLDGLSEDVTGLSASVTSISTTQSQQATSLTTLSNQVSEIETDLDTVESTVSTSLPDLTSRVDELETKVNALSAGSSSMNYDVLFDRASDDPDVTHGFTGGWLGGSQLMVDLTKYTGLRFFVTLGGMGGQYYVKLTNREKPDFLILGANTNASNLYYMKVNIPMSLNRIQVAYTGTITINSDGTVTRTQGTSANTNHFVSRVEAYF